MDYIEFKNGLYIAHVGEVVIDNHIYFDSRANYIGYNGPSISFEVNGFNISWITNFGFGRYHQGTACVSKDRVLLLEYDDIFTTQGFVEILNKFITGEINMLTIMKSLACYSKRYRDQLIDYERYRTLKQRQSWLSMDVNITVECDSSSSKTRHDYWLKNLNDILDKLKE
jgi:hypothetical protein